MKILSHLIEVTCSGWTGKEEATWRLTKLILIIALFGDLSFRVVKATGRGSPSRLQQPEQQQQQQPVRTGRPAISADSIESSEHQTNTTGAESRESNALEYLKRYGYLNKPPGGSHSSNQLMSEEAFMGAVSQFQRFAGLHQTGLVDEQTWLMMQTPRCGNQDAGVDAKPTLPRLLGTTSGADKSPGSANIRVRGGIWGESGSRARRKRRYALQGSKWRRLELTYRISQYPSRFVGKRHDVDQQIERAFNVWSQVAPIKFVVKREGRVHIDIRFASGDHGDGDAFDGPGNTLAHAYFPQYGGDAHFDDQEFWTIDSYAGTNIFQVAAHELGHSLGLGHSNVREALMAPFYQKYKPQFRLHPDDVLAIQALYGEKTPGDEDSSPSSQDSGSGSPLFPFWPPSSPPSSSTTSSSTTTSTTTTTTTSTTSTSTTTTTPPPTDQFEGNTVNRQPSGGGRSQPGEPANDEPIDSNNIPDPESAPDLCADPTIDTVTRTEDGSTYVFKGDYYWRLTSNGLAKRYPRPIGADWEGLPGKLDAALTWADGKTFFFKGNKYWRFKNRRRDLGYPKLISVGFSGIPDNIDAAFVWSGNGRTYIFKGAEYWRFDSKSDPPVSSEYPRSIKTWTGVPAHINAAFKWENNVTYFFKGNQYYRFNDKEFKAETRGRPQFPRNSAEWWFGCSPTTSNLLSLRHPIPSGSLRRQPEADLGEWSFFASAANNVSPGISGTHISDQKPKEPTEESVDEPFRERQPQWPPEPTVGFTDKSGILFSTSSSAISPNFRPSICGLTTSATTFVQNIGAFLLVSWVTARYSFMVSM